MCAHAGNTTLDCIEQYTLYSGRPKPLPDWIGNGAVVGLQVAMRVVDFLSSYTNVFFVVSILFS
jgi:hypothetical protein